MNQPMIRTGIALTAIAGLALTNGVLHAQQHRYASYSSSELGIIATEAPVASGPYALRVKPGVVFHCSGRDRAVAQVSWSSADSALALVDIRVAGPGERGSKLFAHGGPQGTAMTGNWVVEGVKFIMVDPSTGRILATREVVGRACA
jgi:hypothetical protein